MQPVIGLYIAAGIFIVLAVIDWSSYGFLAIMMIVVAIMLHLDRNFTVYTLTKENMKITKGIVGKTASVIPLLKVQEVTGASVWWQQFMGVGNVLVESAANEINGIVMVNVDNPEEYVKKILEAIPAPLTE